MDDKENAAPQGSGIAYVFGAGPLAFDAGKKGRSKSMGPGGASPAATKAIDRRKSALPVPVRSILPGQGDTERKAARRKSLAERRVSFAPEATLHTWDVIDYLREHTNSTASTDGAALTSNREHAESDESDSSESEEDVVGDEDNTSASMSLDGDTHMTSGSSGSSTSSSAQLERNLRMAAETAGTRGIAYDEFGDMSMEMVEEEVTNAFKPWINQDEETRRGSAVFDQENLDPFLAQQSKMSYIQQTSDHIIQAEHFSDDEQTMDFTVIAPPQTAPIFAAASPRKRSATQMNESAQPEESPGSPRKRMRLDSSPSEDKEVETMQFTQAFGAIRPSTRLSFASFDENEDMSMELTTVLGGIQAQQPAVANDKAEASPSTPISDRKIADATPTSQPSRSSRRQSASPGRRSSARLRNSLARITEEVNEDSPSPATPTNRTRSAEATPKATVAASVLSSVPSVKQSSPFQPDGGVAQSSPFQTVASSPAFERTLTRPHTVMTFSPLAGLPPIDDPLSTLVDNIKMLSTPRKETLKSMSPVKRYQSPIKTPQLLRSGRQSLKKHSSPANGSSPRARDQSISLQRFLDEAGIRFMDLTTSKRRATIAPTPSKAHATLQGLAFDGGASIPLDEAIISAACTEPELELYKHACNELRRYIDGGKADIKMLEDATLADTPELIRRYMQADPNERAAIDTQLREIKTNARLRSKEMWYGWRSNLVDDLMKVLQSIAEGLLNDDDILQDKETLIAKELPRLLAERDQVRAEADALQAASDAVPEEQKEELNEAREQLSDISQALNHKQSLVAELEAELAARDERLTGLDKQKQECMDTIERSDRLKTASDDSSANGIDQLQESIKKIEAESGWTITSSTTRPATMMMQYKSQLEFFFHPLAFMTSIAQENAPLSLSYIGAVQPVPTCQRFFLQLLRARLHELVQSTTKIGSALQLIASTWDMATQTTEAIRCMSIESPTEATIQSDECLRITSSLLFSATKTKVAATIKLTANTASDDGLRFLTGTDVKVVYGSTGNLELPRRHFSEMTAAGSNSWPSVVHGLHDLISKTTGSSLRRAN